MHVSTHHNQAESHRAVFARLLPFLAYLLFLAVDSHLLNLAIHVGVDVRYIYLLRLVVVCSLLIYYWRDYIELTVLPTASDFLYALIAGCMVFVIWIFPYPAWLGGGEQLGFNPEGAHGISLVWTVVRFSGAVLIVPVMEELFWRSYVMRWFDNVDFLSVSPERISGYAYLGSAFLFAIEHHLWLAGLFAGLVYGELYKTYKNLWVPIFAHAVTNLILSAWIVMTGNWGYW